jgi:hypothetical protein
MVASYLILSLQRRMFVGFVADISCSAKVTSETNKTKRKFLLTLLVASLYLIPPHRSPFAKGLTELERPTRSVQNLKYCPCDSTRWNCGLFSQNIARSRNGTHQDLSYGFREIVRPSSFAFSQSIGLIEIHRPSLLTAGSGKSIIWYASDHGKVAYSYCQQI